MSRALGRSHRASAPQAEEVSRNGVRQQSELVNTLPEIISLGPGQHMTCTLTHQELADWIRGWGRGDDIDKPWPMSGPSPVFVHKVLLEHSLAIYMLSLAAVTLQCHS